MNIRAGKTPGLKYYLAIAVSLITFAVYLAALQNEFIGWDDGTYIIENTHLRSLNGALLKWALFDFYASNWHPLTWMSHALDYAVWGLYPLGHHLTNNILHAFNTFLVVLLVVRLLEARRGPEHLPHLNQGLTNHPCPSLTKEGSLVDAKSSPPILGGVSEGQGGNWNKVLLPDKPPLCPCLRHLLLVLNQGGELDGRLTSHVSRFTLITAATTGLLFGLHPLHVESVAWVSERKDLLCALFYLLSVMAYVKYAGATSHRAKDIEHSEKYNMQRAVSSIRYALGPMLSFKGPLLYALCFFVLALMSKPMAVSLPFVLLVLDWYPLEKTTSLRTFWNSVLEKLPFIALSIASSVLTVLAQEKAMFLNEIVPLPARVLVAARAIFVYLGKLLLPMDLSPFYPYSGNVFLLSPRYYLPLLLLIGITAAFLYIGKRQKIWLSVWFYYLFTLVPVLGIVQVGRQAMADRYTYLPSIGPFLITGLLVAWIYRKVYTSGRDIKLAYITSVLSLVIFMSFLTYRQIGIWSNSVGFWSYVILKEPEVPFAYYGRGLAFYGMGLTDKALEDYNKAITLDPSYFKAYASRGLVFEKMEQMDKAIADYDRAIALNPLEAQAYNSRGAIFEKAVELEKAISDYDKVISLVPDESQSYNNRAVVFEKMGRFDKAVADYDISIALDPSKADLYYNRGNAYDGLGRSDKAIADYDKAIALNPRDSQAYNNRGVIFEKMGKFDKAIADYDKAVALNPSNSEAYNNRRTAIGRKMAGSPKQMGTPVREETNGAVH